MGSCLVDGGLGAPPQWILEKWNKMKDTLKKVANKRQRIFDSLPILKSFHPDCYYDASKSGLQSLIKICNSEFASHSCQLTFKFWSWQLKSHEGPMTVQAFSKFIIIYPLNTFNDKAQMADNWNSSQCYNLEFLGKSCHTISMSFMLQSYTLQKYSEETDVEDRFWKLRKLLDVMKARFRSVGNWIERLGLMSLPCVAHFKKVVTAVLQCSDMMIPTMMCLYRLRTSRISQDALDEQTILIKHGSASSSEIWGFGDLRRGEEMSGSTSTRRTLQQQLA
ncbi:hypothetical protein MIR68_002825 [Amoeboaphelidium protococcarum]|nr:hypothetical protein MIR68_002825 [Amoeboaphelidium protococcarum]